VLPHGTGLGATHPPRIWSVSPSDSLPGSVTARGQARQQLTWFTGYVTSLGSGRHGLRVKTSSCAARLLAHRAPPWDRPWRDASPQDLERITVRLPSGIGHGQGPCSAHADLVYPKVVPVTSPAALTDNRSRHPVGPGAQPDPVSIRHDARAISSPSALAEHANLPTVLEKDPTGKEYVTLYDKVYAARLLKGHGVSHTSWRPLSAS
jgi:hypothetical protein